jgi:hypothetical protein
LNVQQPDELLGNQRRATERWNLPPVAVREAVVNAVAHADYAQRGAPIRVAIFDDRLEVELSPRAAMRPTVSEPPERALLPSGRLDAPFSQLYPALKVALSRIRGGAVLYKREPRGGPRWDENSNRDDDPPDWR